MSDTYLSEDLVRERFDADVNISPVTRSVFQITDSDGSHCRYAKVWPEHRRTTLEELTSVEADIGMPNHRMIKGKPHILVMEPANGQLLSEHLPKVLSPVLWPLYKNQTFVGFEDLGKKIGRLHSQTYSCSKTLDASTLSFDKYDAVCDGGLAQPVRRHLDQSTVDKLERQLTIISDIAIETSLVHGDLMLFHIFVDDTNVTLIDFDAARQAHCIDDIVRFICALELFIKRLPYARKKQFKQLRAAFNRGYQQTGHSFNLSLQSWNVLRAIRYCSLLMYYHNKLKDDFQRNEKHSKREQLKLRILRKVDSFILKRMIKNLML